MEHCKVSTDDDGTVHATNGVTALTILPDGESKAFNRNFIKQTMFGGKLHARLNNLAARIQQGKISEDDAWLEVSAMVEAKTTQPHTRWLVGELNGVRVYISDDNIIMTTRDLYS